MAQRIEARELKALGRSFPARELTTELGWRDLAPLDHISSQFEDLRQALHARRETGQATASRILFTGPSGTGKTLAGVLLGRDAKRPVIYVDLPNLISKYIGETEKNLSRLLKRAEAEDWLLFFDEADALFGKRGSVKDAHDRFANQEVSYLIQRMENFDDIVIFAGGRCPDPDHPLRRFFHRIVCFSDSHAKSAERERDT